MSRPLRIMYPNAFYHVINRDSGRQCIFTHDDHFNIFLDLFAGANTRYQLEIHAYYLMNNHYHLLVCTPIPNLTEIMRFINGSFTQKINRLNRTDGPIFRGRYKAILVEKHIAIYLALQLPGQKIRILKKYFNNSNQSISQIYNRAKKRAKTDEIFLNHIKNIKEKLELCPKVVFCSLS